MNKEAPRKIDPVVLQMTGYVALWTAGLSIVMELVFVLIGKWDLTVLWGNLLAAAAGILNFFLMGLTVQKAVTKDEKNAKSLVQISQTGRLILLFGAAVLGAGLPCFNTWAAIIPLLFPQIALRLRPLFEKKKGGEETL